MTSILIFIIILLAAAVLALIVFARKEARKRGTNTKEEFVGICKSAIETASQKDARKQKALGFLAVPPCAIWMSWKRKAN
ncbi:MAG: hypothetical protein UV98_C0047G0005 [Parcubacteria group bacterium GW2011_GWB1_43_6]|nr:MAG: hypothetical protein UV98_C0047G0005 [Parcubacteria group bacterium GW2011_GWB1_43_6]